MSTLTLSVCIPIYNTDVSLMVKALSDDAPDEVCEILLLDDGSKPDITRKNKGLESLHLVRYMQLNNNVGRAKARNLLGKEARGDFILFLDNDVLPTSAEFLDNYTTKLAKHKVLCGGLQYPATADKGCELHQLIGTYSESKPAKDRNKHPNKGFHSSNFAIERQLFLSIQFDESLQQYGHEDTLFGYQLYQQNIPVKHFNNPVLHEYLEKNKAFLKKTDLALENLVLLYKREGKALADFVTILGAYERLKAARTVGVFALMYKTSSQRLSEKLLSKNPSVSAYKRYKLLRFCFLMKSA